jgi:PTH1 family peptidyl-tRNA hydrolase
MKLIVGLGNPLKKYHNTRHNIGFWILDNIFPNIDWKEKFSSLYFETTFNDEKIIFIKPQTYMNASGEAVQKFCNYYGINSEEILVIQDDIDMVFGKIKIKSHSSSGGHNGIKSIIDLTHSEDFYRLKIGINNDQKKDAKDFVLSKFTKEEIYFLNSNIPVYKDIIDLFIKNDILNAMNKYN